MYSEVILKVVRIQEPGVRIIGKRTGFELEFHSEFCLLNSRKTRVLQLALVFNRACPPEARMDRICRIRKCSFIPQARESEENPGSTGLSASGGSSGRLYAFFLWRLIPRLRDRWITPGGGMLRETISRAGFSGLYGGPRSFCRRGLLRRCRHRRRSLSRHYDRNRNRGHDG